MKKTRRKVVKKAPRKKARKASPPKVTRYAIFARKGSGPRMHFDGKNFSQRATMKSYATAKEAYNTALTLMRKFSVLRKYALTIEGSHSSRP